jgi:hypothetical protein
VTKWHGVLSANFNFEWKHVWDKIRSRKESTLIWLMWGTRVWWSMPGVIDLTPNSTKIAASAYQGQKSPFFIDFGTAPQ